GMVRRDAPADRSHVEALLRLVGRRPDADLVFADAGRRAARRAVRRLFVLTRLAARTGPRALGYVAARRAARAVFAGDLRRESHIPVARVGDALAVQATPDGAACALYGAGFTELLRLLVGFEGAMLHVSCRATGGEVCEWRAAPPDPRPRRCRSPTVSPSPPSPGGSARSGPTAGCSTISARSIRSPGASSETPGWARGACSSCCRVRVARSRSRIASSSRRSPIFRATSGPTARGASSTSTSRRWSA